LLAGANSNAIWPNGDSLLGSYARAGNVIMLHLLLQFGAEINYSNPLNGETALILAVKHGHLEASKLLHQYGALLTVCDRENRCALVHAAIADSVALLSFLLECDWNLRSSDSSTIRSQAIKHAFETAASLGRVKICEYLLDSTDAVLDTSSAMCIACSHGQSQMVQFLLSRYI
jgi:ankyrin repeat protein